MHRKQIGSAFLAVVIGLGFTTTGPAQGSAAAAPAPKRADPLDAQANVPATQYRSALTAYRPNVEQAVGSWRDANDSAGKAGGWRAYAREANAPDASAAPAPSPATPQAAPAASAPAPATQRPGGHGAHGKH